jgi:hypothetical protein
MQTDLLGNPIVFLEERRGALGRRQAIVLAIPGFTIWVGFWLNNDCAAGELCPLSS